MRRIPPPKRRPTALRRIAAVTASALGAALLINPGNALAQTAIDCSELPDSPMTSGVEAALDTAIACDVEVRVAERSGAYTTVYATPQGRLHLVVTAGAVQDSQNRGTPDPTLTAREGVLVQNRTEWPFSLQYDEPSLPLIDTGVGSLDWSGETPVPTYSGTTASYDEIAAGLDLTVDVGASSANLRFTADDAPAWNALATGITVSAEDEVRLSNGALVFETSGDYPLEPEVVMAPFTVRDAEGVVSPVALTLDDAGTLTASLPEGFLDTAAFPLRLRTQWFFYSNLTSSWGSTTSAAPDLSLFLGEGGMDEPYFHAAGEAGDVIVGPYCDALVDPTCSSVYEAESYWRFAWPMLENLRPSSAHQFFYPVASASFRINAAEGTACVAPDLHRTTIYTVLSTWNRGKPTANGPSVSGTCQDRTASYDLTESFADTWLESTYRDNPALYFGMLDSVETARFDGSSARLDVHLDIAGFGYTGAPSDICSVNRAERPLAYDSDTTPAFGGFSIDTWRTDLFDLDLSWTATFYDRATDTAVLSTEAREAVLGPNPILNVGDPLEDGRYEVRYEFTSATTGISESKTCFIVVDTSDPHFSNIIVGGPQYVGGTVDVGVSAGDEGFPDPWNPLTVDCLGEAICGADDSKVITRYLDADFDLRLTGTSNSVQFRLEDMAGNAVHSEVIEIPATYGHREYSGDGVQDLLAVRESDGRLMFYKGRGDGTFESGIAHDTGWGGMDIVMSGDLDGDTYPDLLARDTKWGDLYLYRVYAYGSAPRNQREHVGTGWNAMGAVTSAGDFDEDGNLDLLATRKSDGRLYFYPGRGDGTFGSSSVVGTGWNVMDTISTIGDVNRDGHYDLFARDSRTGEDYLYFGDGDTGFGNRVSVSHAMVEPLHGGEYSQVAAVGDQDGDGYEDVMAVDAQTGRAVLHSFDEHGDPVHAGKATTAGWSGIRLPATTADRTYDYDNDGASDVIARRDSNGYLYLYPGNRNGFGSAQQVGTGWNSMDLIETAGDFNGDNFADIIARDASTGELYLYPGDGRGGFQNRRFTIGTGWDAMSAIVSGHDYDGDGHVDVLAVEADTGYLWLYAGSGDGSFNGRERIGTGWNSMREITAAGDLDHDGHADLIAVRGSDDCGYFYPGRGDGTFGSAETIDCRWDVWDSFAGVGDFDGDGHADLVARHVDGELVLFTGIGSGTYFGRVSVGTGWNAMSAIA